jgi:hypothetical protein
MEDAMKRYLKAGVITLVISLAFIVALSLPACRRAWEKPKEPAKETEVTVPTAPAEVCADFAGKWDTNRGELTVVQKGCGAEGTLKGIGGGYYKLEGHVTNDTWDFTWKGPAGRGKGYFTMDPAGGKFTGEHGDGDSNTGKGRWDGTIVK